MACSSPVTADNWHRTLRGNFPELLRSIDTESGLRGELHKRNFNQFVIKRLWDMSDKRTRIEQLLTHILQGDFSRFNSFCGALCASNQKESVVDSYLSYYSPSSLSGSSLTVTDSRAPAEVIPQPCFQTLSCAKHQLIRNHWNELTMQVEWGGMRAHLSALTHGFTDDQIEGFESESDCFKRIEAMLQLVLQGSEQRFAVFCHALCETNQHQLVTNFLTCPALVVAALPSCGGGLLAHPSELISPACQDLDQTYTQAVQETEEAKNERVATFVDILEFGSEIIGGTGIESLEAVNVQTTQEVALPSEEVRSQEQLPTTTDVRPTEQLPAQDVKVNGPQTAVQEVGYSPSDSTHVHPGGASEHVQNGHIESRDNETNLGAGSSGSSSHEPLNAATGVTGETVPHQVVDNRDDDVIMYILFKPVSPDLYNAIKDDCYQIEYPLTRSFRGRAVIINNEKFTDPKCDRPGSQADKTNLVNLFTILRFDVMVYENLTAQEIIDVCDKERVGNMSNGDQLIESEVFVLCMLSHGQEGGNVIGRDGNAVEVRMLMDKFDGENCPSLLYKPKIFIIQACQGDKQTRGVSAADVCTRSDVSQDAPVGSTPRPRSVPDAIHEARVHQKADMLVARATVDNYVAFRHQERGSWFIRSIVKVFSGNAHKDDVISMLTKVADIVKDMKTEDEHLCVQISEKTDTLTKKVYLLPSSQ